MGRDGAEETPARKTAVINDTPKLMVSQGKNGGNCGKVMAEMGGKYGCVVDYAHSAVFNTPPNVETPRLQGVRSQTQRGLRGRGIVRDQP